MEDGQNRGLRLKYIDTTYQLWQRGEGVPIYTGAFVEDLHTAEVADWPRVGQKGAIIQLAAQEQDDGWLIEIAPGGKTEVLRHLFEATIYVVEGRGTTTFWQAGSNKKQTTEWQTGSLFSPPLNCCYQHFNLDGQRPLRLFAGTTAPLMMNAVREAEFVFDCPYSFRSRYDERDDYFSDPGRRLPNRRWQTNLVPDTRTFNLDDNPTRGRGNSSIWFAMSGNGMDAHISEFPPGMYKKAHRHDTGAHLIILSGVGYSLLWFKGQERMKVDWREGSLFSPREDEYHQHFNTGPTRARYLAYTYSNLVARNTLAMNGTTTSEEVGGSQIEYEDEDPEVFEVYRRECAEHGATVTFEHPAYSRR